MEFLLIFLVIIVLFIAAFVIALLVGRARAKKKIEVFNQYVSEYYPELVTQKMLTAAQASKQSKLDIALIIDDEREEIVLLIDQPEAGMTSKVYKFKNFTMLEPTSRVIERGMFPNKIFSYEKSLNLHFDDGQVYHFFIEYISNRHGDDKGADIVNNVFAPWEERLSKITNRS